MYTQRLRDRERKHEETSTSSTEKDVKSPCLLQYCTVGEIERENSSKSTAEQLVLYYSQ